MKVGIVGVGFMGTTHAAGWVETPAEIVGFTAETQRDTERKRKPLRNLYVSAVIQLMPQYMNRRLLQ